MNIYRNKYVVDGKNTGYSFHTSRTTAAKFRADFHRVVKETAGGNPMDANTIVELIEVERSAKGIIEALTKYGSHPEND